MLLVIVKTYPVPSGHLRDARKGEAVLVVYPVTQPEVESGEGSEKGAFFFSRGICDIRLFVRSYEGGGTRVRR